MGLTSSESCDVGSTSPEDADGLGESGIVAIAVSQGLDKGSISVPEEATDKLK